MDQDWPAQSSELWPIEKITPYARNSRTHSDEQVAQIAASIREWGWTNPVLVDEDGGLIAGHGRLLAARKLGLTQIPTMVAKGWSEAQKRAYVIADNKLALNAGWDRDLLAIELQGAHARGASVVDWRREGGRPDQANILLRYDQARFEALIEAALAAG